MSLSHSRMAHAYPAIQRNRQPAGSFLVLPQHQPQRQSPESSKTTVVLSLWDFLPGHGRGSYRHH
jgi:hypothetical protein